MSPVIERSLSPAAGHPGGTDDSQRKLNIAVIFTSMESTLLALMRAGVLARNLGARILLLAPQVVPYPLPLDSPPVLADWSEERFRAIASESFVETVVRLYLCRDRVETLRNALGPTSLVVVGGRKRLWPFTSEKRLARQLRRAGHEVIFTQKE